MTDQNTAGRSAWAENILDAIMPIILANAPQGIGDRDYETMAKSIMARLPDEQKPAPPSADEFTWTPAMLGQQELAIETAMNYILHRAGQYAKAGRDFDPDLANFTREQIERAASAPPAPITLTAAEAAHQIMGKFWPFLNPMEFDHAHPSESQTRIKAEIAQLIATLQAEARAEGILGRLAAMGESTADPIAAQAAADRLMQWADHPGAKELAERTQATQALEQTGPAGGKLHIHMTVDDMTPTIQRIIDNAMAALAERIKAGA